MPYKNRKYSSSRKISHLRPNDRFGFIPIRRQAWLSASFCGCNNAISNNFISNNFITYSSDKCFALVKKELIEIEKRQVVITDSVLKVWLNKELRM